MRRVSTDPPFTCVTCEIEIRGPAVFHVGLPFCCSGCVAGGPCRCSYDDVIDNQQTRVSPVAADRTLVVLTESRPATLVG